MRIVIFSILAAAACSPVATDAPERAILEANETTVTIQAKDSADRGGNLALAQSVCANARLASVEPYAAAGIPVSDYIYLC